MDNCGDCYIEQLSTIVCPGQSCGSTARWSGTYLLTDRLLDNCRQLLTIVGQLLDNCFSDSLEAIKGQRGHNYEQL